jgi:hypothetical protein
MSSSDETKSLHPATHFRAGLHELLRLDQVRFINIVGSIQYGLLYCVAYLIIGTILHFVFPTYQTNEPLSTTIGWILVQSIVIILIVFYTQKFIEMIPGILSFFPQYFDIQKLMQKGYKPYKIQEYRGDMASSIVLIGTQFHLLEKIAMVTAELANRYF